MKKGLSLILCLVLVISSFAVAFADSSESYEAGLSDNYGNYDYYALVLNELGVFKGTDNGFELERAATRAEALVMFLRILGVDRQAEEENIQPSFDDVPSWAKAYVGYAEANGLASGVGGGKFGSNNAVSAKDYATFLLRGLGYSDASGDFSWNNSVDFLAAKCSLLDSYVNYIKTAEFIRGDMALLSHEALVSNTKGGIPLVEKLGMGIIVSANVKREARYTDHDFWATFSKKENPILGNYYEITSLEHIYSENPMVLGFIDALSFSLSHGKKQEEKNHYTLSERERGYATNNYNGAVDICYLYEPSGKNLLIDAFSDNVDYIFVRNMDEIFNTVSEGESRDKKYIAFRPKLNNKNQIIDISEALSYDNEKGAVYIDWNKIPDDLKNDFKMARMTPAWPSTCYCTDYLAHRVEYTEISDFQIRVLSALKSYLIYQRYEIDEILENYGKALYFYRNGITVEKSEYPVSVKDTDEAILFFMTTANNEIVGVGIIMQNEEAFKEGIEKIREYY